MNSRYKANQRQNDRTSSPQILSDAATKEIEIKLAPNGTVNLQSSIDVK